MRFFEAWVHTPLAQAIGWTLLHSLWQGAIVAAALAAMLPAVRPARARYAAACAAMLVMLSGIALTLIRVMPEGLHGLRIAGAYPLPAWIVQTDTGANGSSSPSLAAIVPWFAPFWMLGVWIFVLRQVAGWVSVAGCAGGAFVVRLSAGRTSSCICAPGCGCRGPSCCWNPAWRMSPWSWVTFARSF